MTMAALATGPAPTIPLESAGLAKTDFVVPQQSPPYAIAVDSRGKLYWQTNAIDGDHVIAVLTEQASPEYLAFLQAQHVSYLFAGAPTLDLATALAKLAALFPIKTLLLEEGGKLNGAMLRAGLIDELSLLLAPIADGTTGTPPCLTLRMAWRPSTPRCN
jgi:2,5-diamino-6-(ribosylamino)-4(3H)-pyrimidinone 5'-phosphate reductase